ncbi:OmpA family protein [Arthrospiribacter ruber]|uniref:OmpA family protein n=1 Tax=Arthrospiribacter ruber TaxID=2487934 RepID=A0A951IWN3_9BACT|nr:OmpA family protein [Arthrospiribacter ruber]MBW3467579.1 OmpA family protein [Arthrospiribacter ruber]
MVLTLDIHHLLKRLFLLLFFGTLAGHLSAQNSLLRYADKQYAIGNYAHAAEVYENAFSKKEKYASAVKLAEVYSQIKDYEKAYQWSKQVIDFDEAERRDYLRYLVAAMQVDQNSEPEDLLAGSGFEEFDFPELDFGRIAFLKSLPSSFRLEPLAVVNSEDSDFGYSADSKGNVFFTSDRGPLLNPEKASVRLDAKNNIFSKDGSDFNNRNYFSLFRKDKDGETVQLQVDLPGALHVSDPHVTRDGKKIFYTAVLGKTRGAKREDIANQPGIYLADLDKEGNLSNSKGLPFNSSFAYGVMHPFLDENESRLYFASDMPGGVGGYDIYYVEYDEKMVFGKPVNLGPEINTSGNESHPSKNGEKFYFSSSGHSGLGGLDIFSADYREGIFTEVKNMGAPFNSPRDDFAFRINDEGISYLSSDREGGLGQDDIYLIKPLQKFLLAKLWDCEGVPFEDDYEAMLIKRTQGVKIPTTRGSQNELLAELDPEEQFELKIEIPGFFTIEDQSLSSVGMDADTLRRDYTLMQVPYNLTILTDTIYYDLDKFEIRKDAVEVLESLGEVMKKYDFIELVVSSHTDSRASHAYNEKLSERRADAVREYVSKFGIGPDRVKLRWFGEEKLINDCGDGVKCPEQSHQMNRRSEMILEAFSDSDKIYFLPKGWISGSAEKCNKEDLKNLILEK